MKRLSVEQLKKLAAVELIAEINDNFDILNVLNQLVYVPGAKAPAWTDGKTIGISDKLFTYDAKDIYFILNHEFDHIYYRHHNRFGLGTRKDINHYLVNIATDLIINEILEDEDGLKIPSTGISRRYLQEKHKRRIVGRTSEEVYKELLDIIKDEQEDKKQQHPGDESSGENQTDNSGDQGNNENKDSTQESDNNNDSESSVSEILSDLLGKDFAKRYKQEIDDQEDSIRQTQQEVREEEIKSKADSIQERVQAKKIYASKRRNSEFDRNYTPPKIDWKKILRRYLGSHLKRAEARNYRRPSNRYAGAVQGIIMPSNRGYVKTPKINVYLDVSGSMHGIINNVRTQLIEAQRFFKQYKGKYYEFDTEIVEFKRKDFFENTGAEGGGTDLVKVVRHYRQDRTAELGIIVTDGEADFLDELNTINKPLLLLTNNSDVRTNNRNVTLVITNFE